MSASETDIATTADENAKQLSEQWLDLATTGRETLAETLAEFIETVEKVVPVSAGVDMQRQIIDSGLQMAQTMARIQHDALRRITHSMVLVNVEVDTDVDVDVDVASREPTS
jgi:hypothetical protein